MAPGRPGQSEDDEGHKGVQTQKDSHRKYPQYGNFRRYYSIRRQGDGEGESQDPRLASIMAWLYSASETERRSAKVHPKIGKVERVLDIGCNSGQLTIQFCEALQEQTLTTSTVIAVDVDRELVLLAGSTARKHNFLTSRPERASEKILGIGRVGRGIGNPRKRLRLEGESKSLVVRFLQSDWVYNDIACLDSPSNLFRKEMSRMQQDDSKELRKEDQEKYDMILALSVSKWIHIQHADSGLRRFFARVACCLAARGVFILEPQAYKSYKHTLKVTAPDSQPRRNFYALRVLPDDFAWILTEELGLMGPFTIRAKGPDASVRQIDAFLQPEPQDIPEHCIQRRAALLALTPDVQSDDEIPWVPRERK